VTDPACGLPGTQGRSPWAGRRAARCTTARRRRRPGEFARGQRRDAARSSRLPPTHRGGTSRPWTCSTSTTSAPSTTTITDASSRC